MLKHLYSTILIFFLLFWGNLYSQNTPASVNNLKIWYNADSVEITNGQISKIFDQSGNNFDATQTVIGRQPVLATSNLNNQQSIRFTTSNELDIDANFELNSNTPYTIYLILNNTLSGNSVSTFLQLKTNGNFNNTFSLPKGSFLSSYGSFYSGSRNNTPFIRLRTTENIDIENFGLYEISYSGNGATNLNNFILENNNQNLALTTAPNGLQNTFSKIGNTTANFSYEGDLLEIIIYDKVLNQQEKDVISDYLKTKYSPNLDLGADINLTYGVCDTTLNAGSGFKNYLWNTGDTTETISVNQPGEYWVSVTDFFGFTSTDTLNLIRNYYNNISLGTDTTICLGDSLTLTALNQDYDILWQNSTTDSIQIANQAGEYFYILTDSFGCSINSDTINLSIDDFSLNISLGGDTSLCGGNEIGLSGSASNQITSYLWKDNSTNPTLTIDTSGTYWVEVQNLIGCKGFDAIDVIISGLAPVIDFTFDTVCVGDSFLLTDNSFTIDNSNLINWLWTRGSDTISTNSNFSYQLNQDSVIVDLFVETDNGCSNLISKNVFGYKIPEADFLINGNICLNDSVLNNDVSTFYNGFNSRSWQLNGINLNTVNDSIYITLQQEISSLQLTIEDQRACKDSVVKSLNTLPAYLCNQPNQIQNIKLWYNADSVEIINGKVSKLFDQSGNNNHATQTNTNKQPILTTTNLNNKQAIMFTTSHDIDIDNNFELNSNSPYTIYIIINSTNTNNSVGTFLQLKTNGPFSNTFALPTGSITSSYGSFFSGSRSNTPFVRFKTEEHIDTEIYGLFKISFSGNSSNNLNDFIIKNNNEILNTSTAPNTLDNNFSKIGNTSSNFDYKGDLLELILFDKTLDSSEVNTINTYIKDKYMPKLDLGPDIVINYGFCDTTLFAGNDFKEYLWSNGDTSSSIVVNEPGVYWVRVIDQFGFETTDSINVIRPLYENLGLGADTTICLGESLNFNIDTTNYNINWFNSSSSNQINVDTASQIYFTLTDTNNCIYNSDTLNLFIDDFKNNVSLGADTSLCAGNFVKLKNGDSLVTNYLWSNGSDSSKIQVDTSGTYWVELINQNNCIITDSININIIGQALQSTFLIENNCLNDTIKFINTTQPSGDIANSFWIFDQDTLSGLTVDTIFDNSGNYNVTMITEAANSCKSDTSSSFEIIQSPTANFSFTEICVNNPTLILNNSLAALPSDTIISSEWRVNGAFVSNDFDLEFTFTSTGLQNVSLEITDQNGCKSFLEQTVEVFGTLPLPSNFTVFSPSNNYYFSLGEQINFNWNNANNVVRFKLNIFEDFDQSLLFYSQDSILNNSQTINISASGKYFWNVTAYNACGDSTISNTYTFEVRSPLDNQQLSLWLKADTGLILDANNRVEQWRDLSNNIPFNQLINVSKPLVEQNSINGHPTIRFNGNQFLNGGNVLNIGTNSRSMFIIGKSDNSSVTRSFFAKSILASAFGRFAFYISGANSTNFILEENNSISKIINFPFNNNNRYFIGSLINDRQNAENRVEFNNQLKDNIPINPSLNIQTNFRFLIGAYNNANDNGETFHLNGNIAEIIFIDDADPQSILDIQNYLRYKYSPPINLGPDIKVDYGFCGVDIVADSRFVSYLWNTGDTTATITADYPGEYWVEVIDIFGYTSSDTIQVIRPDYDIFDLQDEIICLNDTTSLTANLIKNYTIEWNTGSTDSTITITQPGDYFFTAFDTLGCSTTSKIANIEIDSIVNFFSLGADTTLCSGNLIGAASGTQFVQSYLWNTGSNEPEIEVSSPFNYYVTVTSFNGCVASDTVFIDIQGVAPTIVYNYPLEICQDANFNYSENSFVTGPDSIVSRIWDFGDGITSNNPNGNYNYAISGVLDASLEVVSNTGCYEKINFNIYVNPKPQVDFVYSNACSEKGTMFNGINNTNNTIVTWEWDFGDINSPNNTASGDVATHKFSNAGFYNVRLVVMDNFGCRDTVEKNIYIFQSPVADFDVNTTCIGDSSFFNSTSFVLPTQSITNYNWNFGNGQNSNLQNPTIFYNSTAQYNVRLEVNTNLGCRDTVEKTIRVFDVPEAFFTLDTICVNSPIVLIDESNYALGQNPNEVLWTLGNDSLFGNPRTYTFTDTLNYQISLSITDSVGCKDNFSMNKKVHPVPTAAFNISPTLVVIDQEQNFINFSDNENDFFLWNFGDGDFSNDFEPSHIYSDTGEYTIWLTAENPFTCADSVSRKINVFPQALDIAISNVISNEVDGYYEIIVTLQNLGTTVINTADLIIELPKGRTLSESWQGQIFSGQQTNYQLNTRISKGINLDEIDFICVTAVNPNNQLDELNIENNIFCLNQSNQKVNFALPYPNPFNEFINILFFIEESGSVKLSMFDNNGKIVEDVIDANLPRGFHQRRISTEGLNVGAYYLKLNFRNEEQITKKVIKNN